MRLVDMSPEMHHRVFASVQSKNSTVVRSPNEYRLPVSKWIYINVYTIDLNV